MPPTPISAVTSYGPKRVPGTRVMGDGRIIVLSAFATRESAPSLDRELTRALAGPTGGWSCGGDSLVAPGLRYLAWLRSQTILGGSSSVQLRGRFSFLDFPARTRHPVITTHATETVAVPSGHHFIHQPVLPAPWAGSRGIFGPRRVWVDPCLGPLGSLLRHISLMREWYSNRLTVLSCGR